MMFQNQDKPVMSVEDRVQKHFDTAMTETWAFIERELNLTFA
jgi:hypothetical protein